MMNAPVYPNLVGQIAAHGISRAAIAATLNCTQRTLRNKLSGDSEFSWGEVNLIREKYFPGCTLEYLFDKSNDPKEEER